MPSTFYLGDARPAGIGLPLTAVCANYELRTINEDNQAKLKAFLEDSGLSMQALADAIKDAGLRDPKGKEVNKSRIWNYVRGLADTPTWFLKHMDAAFPGWENAANITKGGRQKDSRASNVVSEATQRLAPLLPPIGDSDMQIKLKDLEKQPWAGRSLPVPYFLKESFPVQFIMGNDYSPVFRAGDVVQIEPNVYPSLDTLFAVTDRESGKSAYAAFVEIDGKACWVLFDGEVLDVDAFHVDAAVIAWLPQYRPGKEEGVINSRGLNVRTQIAWPNLNKN